MKTAEAAAPSNKCISDSDDEFEEIGTIDFLSAETDCQDERNCGKTAGSLSIAVSSSGQNLKGGTLSDQSNCKDKELSTLPQRIHTNQNRLRVKASSSIRATLQELQMKRMENQAAADKQKILQNRFRVVPWTPTANDVRSTFNSHVGLPVVSPRNRDKIVHHTTTSLPVVRDATKRELLKLNQRYAPSKTTEHRRNLLKKSWEQNNPTGQSEPSEAATKSENTEASPFKLILHGTSSDNIMSSSATVVTPDNIHTKRTQSDVGPESGDVNYLFHLTQLARYSNGATDDVNIDDGASTSHESSSSHASLVHCTSSACNSHSGEDIDSQHYQQQRGEDTIYFSCESKPKIDPSWVLSSMFQNQRLRNAFSVIKQVIIIFGIALFFAWVELAKDKIMHWLHTNLLWLSSLTNACIKATKDEITAWLKSNFQIILQSVNATWQSARGAIATSYQNTLYQVTSLAIELIGLVQDRLACWHQIIVQSSISLASSARQKSLYNIQATREMLSNFGQLHQQHQSFISASNYLSSLAWNGLGLLYYDWIKDIDLTSTAIELWFRVRRAQLDCSLLYYDTRQRLKEFHGAMALVWNLTVAVLSECCEEFIKSPSLINNEAVGEPLVLRKSKTTNPVSFTFDEKDEPYSIWNNQTLAPVETGVLRFEGVAISPSFSLLRAPKYEYNPDQFRKNVRFTDGSILNTRINLVQSNEDLTLQKKRWNPYAEHALSSDVQQARTLLRNEAKKHYDSSFPTFSSDPNAGEDTLFDVNLMDIATEATKRLLPRRKRSTTHS
jgi:hypothetical protein